MGAQIKYYTWEEAELNRQLWRSMKHLKRAFCRFVRQSARWTLWVSHELWNALFHKEILRQIEPGKYEVVENVRWNDHIQ